MGNRLNKIVSYLLRPCRANKWVLLTCLLITISYATLSVQGDSSPKPYFGRAVYFEHGWPMEYMKRQQIGKPWVSRWCIFAGICKFEYTPLFQNITIAIGLSLLFTHLWHIHRAHCKPWQFTLKELLLAMLVLSVALGVYAKLQHDYTLAESYLYEMEEIGWESFPYNNPPWYLQPLGDLGIISKDDWSYRGIACVTDTPHNDIDINRVIADQVSKGKKLALVRCVMISNSQLSDRGVELLCKWAPNCTVLLIADCPNVTDAGIAHIASNSPNLTYLYVEGATITDDAIRHIATLQELESLSIDDDSNQTTSKSIKHLYDLPKLESLDAPDHWNIDEEDRAWLLRRKIVVPNPEY